MHEKRMNARRLCTTKEEIVITRGYGRVCVCVCNEREKRLLLFCRAASL